jgi:hypothetical protein
MAKDCRKKARDLSNNSTSNRSSNYCNAKASTRLQNRKYQEEVRTKECTFTPPKSTRYVLSTLDLNRII